jgi:hypothetical protein
MVLIRRAARLSCPLVSPAWQWLHAFFHRTLQVQEHGSAHAGLRFAGLPGGDILRRLAARSGKKSRPLWHRVSMAAFSNLIGEICQNRGGMG